MLKSETSADGVKVAGPNNRKVTHSPPRDEICCIYVHAGAGFHSHQNESIHLDACNDAAMMGMLILKNGGSALDAVEAAIKVLEDREITNAGFGSNLAMDGVVECDASIVDHYGRSGAVGAVAQVKNPIALARLVHAHTLESLTLRRVPPNLLVGQGATDFAMSMGMPILPHDALISPAAKDRWARWRHDLKNAERKARRTNAHPSCWALPDEEDLNDELVRHRMRVQHTQNLLREIKASKRSTPPLSPGSESDKTTDQGLNTLPGEFPHTPQQSSSSWLKPDLESMVPMLRQTPLSDPFQADTALESSRSAFVNSTQKVPTLSQYREDYTIPSARTQPRDAAALRFLRNYGDGSDEHWGLDKNESVAHPEQIHPPATYGNSFSESTSSFAEHRSIDVPAPGPKGLYETMQSSATSTDSPRLTPEREDHITDTVGAIAVDQWGHIACGASSGGIGMKYRGRVGPAALVGVGAAVVPTDPYDPEQTCVATVTSGTGEHMATTMAATVCAGRLYSSVKKGPGGQYIEATEDEALQAMIQNEFMGHPSVQNSNPSGAIGILGLKKVQAGIMIFYGHNTDSFAMASMTSEEERPACAMSRITGAGQIAQGGRFLAKGRRKRAKSSLRR